MIENWTTDVKQNIVGFINNPNSGEKVSLSLIDRRIVTIKNHLDGNIYINDPSITERGFPKLLLQVGPSEKQDLKRVLLNLQLQTHMRNPHCTLEELRELIEAGADPNYRFPNDHLFWPRKSLLQVAVMRREKPALELLLGHGAKVSDVTEAIYLELVSKLFRVNSLSNPFTSTPDSEAEPILNILLEHGLQLSPNKEYEYNEMPPDAPRVTIFALLASDAKFELMLSLLKREMGGNPNVNLPTWLPENDFQPGYCNMCLAEAVIRGNRPDILIRLLAKGLHLDTPLTDNLRGQTILSAMVEKGWLNALTSTFRYVDASTRAEMLQRGIGIEAHGLLLNAFQEELDSWVSAGSTDPDFETLASHIGSLINIYEESHRTTSLGVKKYNFSPSLPMEAFNRLAKRVNPQSTGILDGLGEPYYSRLSALRNQLNTLSE
ncbi:MAG: hypothetical protein JKY15_05885 [Deltaproteobacteria bacterium]|nr:hypothetical protein [Deltaproteobacteria bacterium]